MPNQNELEKVVTLGRIEKEISILSFKVKMRTLTSGEIRDITFDLSGYDDVATFRGMQIKTLARAIIAINGSPIKYIATDENDTITDLKLYQQNENLISNWEKSVVDVFYTKYRELEVEQLDFLSQYERPLPKTGTEKNGKPASS